MQKLKKFCEADDTLPRNLYFQINVRYHSQLTLLIGHSRIFFFPHRDGITLPKVITLSHHGVMNHWIYRLGRNFASSLTVNWPLVRIKMERRSDTLGSRYRNEDENSKIPWACLLCLYTLHSACIPVTVTAALPSGVTYCTENWLVDGWQWSVQATVLYVGKLECGVQQAHHASHIHNLFIVNSIR